LTSWIRSPIPPRRRFTRSSSLTRCSRRRANSRPPTRSICGPEGYTSARLAAAARDGTVGPPGIFIMELRDVRYPRPLGDRPRTPEPATMTSGGTCRATTLVTSEWALPARNSRTGSCRRIYALEQVWPSDPFLESPGPAQRPDDRSWRQSTRWALEVRPAHDPVREYGFVGVVVNTTNLEGLDLDLVARRRQVPHR